VSDRDLGLVRDIPIVEPTGEPLRPDRPGWRRRGGIVAVVLICLVAAAIPVTIRMTSSRTTHPPRHTAKPVDPRSARVSVAAAVAATIAARNYRINSTMSETPGAGASGQQGLTFASQAIVNVDPLAMVATSKVGNLGLITSWTNGTRQWEQGGANYGLTSPNGSGAGAPISGFGSLVEGTLGPREAGVAMMGLASPNGHLDLAAQAIESASQAGTTMLDGSQLTEYDVTLDLAQLLKQPGMTGEQVQAATEGMQFLQQEGYAATKTRIGVDAAGYIRTAHTVWSFSDGGAVTVDTTYHDYGCAGTVVLPTQAPAPPPTATCTSPDPAATVPPGAAATPAPKS
jgi:hypothetical protein